MLCLGIESSCDETALALVRDGRLVESVLASQASLHSLFGGVVPELASREHCRYIGPLLDELLARRNLALADVDVIAAARGPGLLGSLLVGVSFAKALAFALQKPFLGINHLHAHLLAVGLENTPVYPALGLLISGGHTQICRIDSPWSIRELGRTLDDAAGEAFDKIGKAMRLPYPAGKIMDELGRKGCPDKYVLPRPYLDNNNLDFSFSGLKTAAIEVLKKLPPANPENISQEIHDFCASLNLAIAETLCIKLKRALLREQGIKAIWLAGGVAANSMTRRLIAALATDAGLDFLVPSPPLCTDNAAMIAFAGCILAQEGFRHTLDMETIPRGAKIPEDMWRTTS